MKERAGIGDNIHPKTIPRTLPLVYNYRIGS
jgi:hypothetical protein